MKELLPDTEIVTAVTTTNPFQAHTWEQALQAAGIPCKVVGDFLTTGAIGGIPGVPAEIWVAKKDLKRAEEVLEQIGANPTEEEEEEEEEPAE